MISTVKPVAPAGTGKPATEKQIAFITKLVAEKVIPADVPLADPTRLDTRAASNLIDWLLKQPRKPQSTQAEPGYYVVSGNVYVVVKSKSGASIYAKRLVMVPNHNARWDYAPGALKFMDKGTRVSLAAAKTFGHLHGVCIACGRMLTDPKSVEAGIGPVCAKQFA